MAIMAPIKAPTLDLRDLSRHLPVVRTAIAMRKAPPRHLVEAVATDPDSRADLSALCRSTGDELVASDVRDGVFRFLIRKR